jgi:3-hydroxyisobutyrate dehydrogenase-like beta-hydroxyacid dehydrogenase
VVAAAEVIFLCLPGDHAVRSVLLGEKGLLRVLREGQTIVDLSTLTYAATLEVSKAMQDQGVEYLDAPVSGMVARAENATLTAMCGGDTLVFDKVRPLLAFIANDILYMGPSGSGQLAKLVNQLLFDINMAGLAEILPMAAKLGLDPELMGSVINSGTGRSYASEFFIPRILAGHFTDGYSMINAYKDLQSGADVSSRLCIPMPVLAAATATYQTALLNDLGDQDKGAMVRVFEQLMGVEYRRGVPRTHANGVGPGQGSE